MLENLEKGIKKIDENLDNMLELWEQLVNIDSGSYFKKGVDKVARVVSEKLTDLGLDVKIVEYEKAGNAVVATREGKEDLEPVILMGHMDTVFPEGTVEERPFLIEDGIAYGPGVLDMKGGIVQIISVLNALNSINYKKRPIKVILLGDEEIAHVNSDAEDLVKTEAKGAIAAFNCESGRPDGSVVIGRKGVARYRFEVGGVAAHAGNEPEKGRSAIKQLSHAILAIEKGEKLAEDLTVNVGIIGGGVAANIVPDSAFCEVDVRFFEEDSLRKLEDYFRKIQEETFVNDTVTKITGGRTFPAMVTTDAVKRLFKFIKDVAKKVGIKDLKGVSSGGGSDAAHTVAIGVPTICAMGPKGGLNHSPKEYAEIDGLLERSKLLLACILEI